MNNSEEEKQRLSRRRFLAASCGMVVGAGLDAKAAPAADTGTKQQDEPPRGDVLKATEPFWGEHQGGILTPAQSHTYFTALDLVATKREDLVEMLRAWTSAAARMAQGQPAGPIGQDLSVPGPDSGEAMDLPPTRLTVTFGFGAGIFSKDGQDRFGLAARRPAAFVDLPKFNGDQLVEARTGGDLLIQACA